MPISGVLPTIASHLKCATNATRGKNHSFRLIQTESTPLSVVTKSSRDPVSILEQADNGAFHVDIDSLVDAMVLESADHLEAGSVADVC